MAKIKRVVTAQEKEQARLEEAEKQKAREELRERVRDKSEEHLTNRELKDLVILLAKEHGLIK